MTLPSNISMNSGHGLKACETTSSINMENCHCITFLPTYQWTVITAIDLWNNKFNKHENVKCLFIITIGHLFGIRHRPKGRELTCPMSLSRSCLTWIASMRCHKQSTLHGRSVAIAIWLSNLSIRGWKLMVLMVGHGQCSNGLCIADKINSPLQMEIHTENNSGRQPL